MKEIRLNQLLAVERATKDAATQALNSSYHDAQKGALFTGMVRVFTPKDEDGDKLPSEEQILQLRVPEVLHKAKPKLAALAQHNLMKDAANGSAKASVEIDGQVIIADAPATYLLWLEKDLLTNLRTFISKLPKLPSDERWTFDDAQNCYRADPPRTTKTKKINVPVVMAPATKEHQAIVQMGSEDVVSGYWATTKYSGALPSNDVAQYIERVERLIAAVKMARQKANAVTVPAVDDAGTKILGFIFG